MAMRVSAAVVLIACLTGCGDDGVDPTPMLAPDDAPQEAATPSEPQLLPPQEQARQTELRGWSACLRRTEPRIRGSWRRYTAAIDAESGRRARRSEFEPFVHRTQRDLGPCRSLPDPSEGIETIPDELRDVVSTYLASVESFSALTEQLAPYYDNQGYKDDGWELSAKLAPKMAESFAAFESAATQLRASLRDARNVADEAALTALRTGDAPAVAGLAIAVGRDTRAVRACFEVETPDPKACEASLAALKASHGLVVEAVENPSGDRYVFWIEALSRTTGRLVRSAQRAIAAMSPAKGRRRATYGPAHRDEVFVDAAHVEDAADNVRYGL